MSYDFAPATVFDRERMATAPQKNLPADMGERSWYISPGNSGI
jgi:hypothetical protein